MSSKLPIPGSHIPVLDGMSGIAIFAVMVFHIHGHYPVVLEAMPSSVKMACAFGQKGVDLFFVLSGFLITGILIDTRDSPNRWRNFLARRALRIFPLYFFTILVVYNVAPGFFQVGGLSKYQLWLWLYVQNIGATFDWCPDFGHFWSLAVEEQFYLIWPFLVWHCRDTRSVKRLCLTTIGAACVFRLVVINWDPFPASLLLSRMDCLAGGGLLASMLRLEPDPAIWRRVCAITLLLTAFVTAPLYVVLSGSGNGALQVFKFTAYTFLLVSLLGLVISFHSSRRTTSVFASSGLRWLGKYSYSIYVFHPFVMTAVDNSFGFAESGVISGLLRIMIMFAVTITLALLSWHLLEKPALSLKHRFAQQRPLPISASSTVRAN
jgi:peptidoglycan/LPS O-acetylase OafA/YrhL